MTGGRHVVVVDPYSSGNLFPDALRRRGFMPVCVTSSPTPPDLYVPSYRPQDFESVLDGADVAAVVERLQPLGPAAVIPGAETGVELADRLAAELTPERANDPAHAAARRHKGEMIRAVAAAGLSVPRTVCTADAAVVQDWIDRADLAGSDLVLKPPRGGGGNGLTFVPAGGDWRSALEGLLGTRDYYRNSNDEAVIQEHMTGTEYAVDTVTSSGRHAVCAISRYGKVRNGSHVAVYDSIEYLPYDLPGHAEISEYVGAVLDALGVRFGAAHTEVMATPVGLRLVESGVRVAGGGLPAVIAFATGDNPVDRIVNAIGGAPPDRPSFTLRMPTMVVFFIARSAGTVMNAEVLDEVRTLPSFCGAQIKIRTGDRTAPTGDLSTTMEMGWVILGHPDRMRLYADYRSVREIESRLVIAPAVVSPHGHPAFEGTDL
jgi:biotin carboxylase